MSDLQMHPLTPGKKMDNDVVPCIKCGVKPFFAIKYYMFLMCPLCKYTEKNRTWGSVSRQWNYANTEE